MHKTSRAQDSSTSCFKCNVLLHALCMLLYQKRGKLMHNFSPISVLKQRDQQSKQCRYVPKGLGGFFHSQRISNVREMSWWESVSHNDSSTRIVMTPAQVGLSATASKKCTTLRLSTMSQYYGLD